jgi:hypothetical protein
MGRGDPHWYADRHITCEIPVNEYTMKLYELHPEWFPPEFTDHIGPEENPVFDLDDPDSSSPDPEVLG